MFLLAHEQPEPLTASCAYTVNLGSTKSMVSAQWRNHRACLFSQTVPGNDHGIVARRIRL